MASIEQPGRQPNDARGGRLYDNWRLEKKLGSSFLVDVVDTPALDGQGGPNGNGTLNNGAGQPLPNSGHDYRLKNFLGWDLRGAKGIYGASYQDKPYVLPSSLFADTRTAEEIQAWLAQGDEQLPALGQVLDEIDLADLTAFLIKTRDGQLAHPEQIFRLEPSSPKKYVLLPGGSAVRGQKRYIDSCAECHGEDGKKLAIDETESAGTLSRTSGYEVWFKIQNGHPGSTMGRQVSEASAAANSRAILDLLAALCDRKAFPPLTGGKDVSDDDPRCGEYLR